MTTSLETDLPEYGLCLVSKHITKDNFRVGYLYREEPEDEADSGWRIFSAEESDDYLENARNFEVLDVRHVAKLDPTIVPLLDAAPGAVFDRVDGSDAFFDSTD